MEAARELEPTIRVRWTPKLDEQLRSLFADGASDHEIAARMALPYEAVKHRRRDIIGLRGAPRTGDRRISTSWAEQRIEDLKRLWAAGLSASQIADEFGISRSAVIGKVHRLKLDNPRYKRPRKTKGGIVRIYDGWKPKLRLVVDNSAECSAQPRNLTLMELRAGHCRFPVGEPGAADFFFCGADVWQGSYCAHHHRVCYR